MYQDVWVRQSNSSLSFQFLFTFQDLNGEEELFFNAAFMGLQSVISKIRNQLICNNMIEKNQ